jgi:hypothetical protein
MPTLDGTMPANDDILPYVQGSPGSDNHMAICTRCYRNRQCKRRQTFGLRLDRSGND